MSEITFKCYLEETVEKKLKCKSCQKRYKMPKIQPWGCSICVDCEAVIFKSNEPLAEIECLICCEKYELPLKTFILNKSLNNLLDILPTAVSRGDLHTVAMRKLHDDKVLGENYSNVINDSRKVIMELCEIQTNLVDIKTESLIKMLNNQRDSLLEQISEFEKKCLEAVQSLNLEKFLDFLNETEKTCENLNYYLNE
jgi:hypothetical protein